VKGVVDAGQDVREVIVEGGKIRILTGKAKAPPLVPESPLEAWRKANGQG
jgi:hypothetical protein